MLKNFIYIVFAVALMNHNSVFTQTRSYSVSVTPFSSLVNDEFSPVYYKNGIVFCSNLKNNSLITYYNKQKKLFHIFFIANKDSGNCKNPILLSRELTTNFNDGPATFNEKGNIIYYCRNNNIKEVFKDISDSTNKLGIYSAELINEKWTNIHPFTYNNPLFSFLTPALSQDGKRLYFASDMPGGYGGTDLYYCDWKDNDWDRPVNLGPVINTQKNEAYPFACKSGKLFFASEGHKGFGGKDLFFTQEIEGKWINPTHLDSDINSPYDDFGLVTDDDFENGFFSSNRRKTDDIYSFRVNPVQFDVCDSMVKNNYCFLFYDAFQSRNDTLPVKYEWDFGNGFKKIGLLVKHCFPGPGKYEVVLRILDSLKNDSILSQTGYNVELKEIHQVYINSVSFGIIDKAIVFNGLKSDLPGFRISDYLWNFGEGFNIRGPVNSRIFHNKGEYIVKLGLLGQKDSLGNILKACASKKIKIFGDYQEFAVCTGKKIEELAEFYVGKQVKLPPDSGKSIIARIGSDISKQLYSLPVRIYVLDELPEPQKGKIFENLYEPEGSVIEINDTGISPDSYQILLKFVKVLKENPDVNLYIAVHTSDKGTSLQNLTFSEKWAQDFYSYFTSKGITPETLYFKGYGDSRPVAGRKLTGENWNSRVEFIFLSRPK